MKANYFRLVLILGMFAIICIGVVYVVRKNIFHPISKTSPTDTLPIKINTLAEFAKYYHTDCSCYRDIPYGDATWNESSVKGHPLLKQTFDLWLPQSSKTTNVPVVIWAHANASTKTTSIGQNGSANFTKLVKPALDAGYAFVSLEFRHPVVNVQYGAPHYDIASSTQFLRSEADVFHFDKSRFYLVGQSRGAGLGLWTALQKDMMVPESKDLVARESTRFLAVWMFNGQVTFDGEEFASLFLDPKDKTTFLRQYPNDAWFGSSLQSVSAQTVVPVMANYDGSYYHRTIRLSEYDVHLPDFGLALCNRYVAVSRSEYCTTKEEVPIKSAFTGYITFFNQYKNSVLK